MKNLANDELVILEKAVTTEVYGKKSQIALELEEAKQMKIKYQILEKQLREKETIIHTFEREVVEMKTVIENHGEPKWKSMIEHLSDPEKIMWTYNHILPNYLRIAIGELA